jgi:hypothetical protein
MRRSTNHPEQPRDSLVLPPSQTMVLQTFREFWSSRSQPDKGLDLIDKIDALERQLRSYADDAQTGEQTPLFGDIANGNSRNASRPATHQTSEDRSDEESVFAVYTNTSYASSFDTNRMSRFEYSYKPLRIAVQLLRDLALFSKIGTVWLLDRWYRWLFVVLPPGLYMTAYMFITRE